MANPYMRDALVDELEQGVNTTKPIGGKTPLTPGVPANPWDASGSSQNAPRIVTEGDQSYLTEHGNRRALQGQEVGDATKYRDDFWAANPTGFQAGVGPQRNEDYAPATPAPMSGAGGGGGSANRYAGFDTQRAQDPSTSAKDAFYAATQNAPAMPQDKAGSEAWFNQYIKQSLEDRGYKVYSVQGDKAIVGTTENPGGEEIDFNQGADSDASSVAWQSNMAGQTTGGGAPTTGAGPQLNAALTDPNVLDNINKQIESLMAAGVSLDDILKSLAGGTGTTETPPVPGV